MENKRKLGNMYERMAGEYLCGIGCEILEYNYYTSYGEIDIIAKDLPVPHRELCPVSLEEQLICYADKFFSKTRIDSEDSYERVEQKMKKWGDESVEQLRRWREIFE